MPSSLSIGEESRSATTKVVASEGMLLSSAIGVVNLIKGNIKNARELKLLFSFLCEFLMSFIVEEQHR